MKKLATVMFASLATVALAGQPVYEASSSKKTIIPEEPCFAEQELQLDVYGAYAGTQGDVHEEGWGGGIGLNYFFSRHVGVGVDGTVTDGEGEELWHINGHVIVRFPIHTGSLCFAPYISGGGGYQVNGEGNWVAGASAGIEFRLSPRFGIFGEGGYYWDMDGDDNDYAQAKAGIRFIF